MIKNGILQVNEINGTPVVIDLIPTSNKISRPQIAITPKYITVHNTGNTKPSANANANADANSNYAQNTPSYVSWHFLVDDNKIIQNLPINEVAWHAGDGSGDGNYKSIGIEICEHEGIDWDKAKENAAKLIKFLITHVDRILNIYPHQHWSGKYCPHKILDEGWEDFKEYVLNYNLCDVPKWQYNGFDNLVDKGIIQSPEYWRDKLKDNITVGEIFAVINKMVGR